MYYCTYSPAIARISLQNCAISKHNRQKVVFPHLCGASVTQVKSSAIDIFLIGQNRGHRLADRTGVEKQLGPSRRQLKPPIVPQQVYVFSLEDGYNCSVKAFPRSLVSLAHANPVMLATVAYRKAGGESFRVWQVGTLTRERLAQILEY